MEFLDDLLNTNSFACYCKVNRYLWNVMTALGTMSLIRVVLVPYYVTSTTRINDIVLKAVMAFHRYLQEVLKDSLKVKS